MKLTKLQILKFKAKAKLGAKYLDKVKPGWHKKINRHVFMEDCNECIMGQLYGSFAHGIHLFDNDPKKSIKFGFTLGLNKDMLKNRLKKWNALTEAWNFELHKRKTILK